MSRQPSPWNELEKQAAGTAGFRVVFLGDEGYDEARQISNSRFNSRPNAVAFPGSKEQVAFCVGFCRKHGIGLRIRSGGHQHEGMCSGSGVLMVRLSGMNTLPPINERTEEAWLPTGARLEDVYSKLRESNKIIPGGGCKSVNVGGLTLGGGWGLSARKHGLACDSVRAVEVVLDKDCVVVARPNNKYKDLFWALLGSGGGNFGIATRFLFELQEIDPCLSKYKVYWKGKHRTRVIERWLRFQREEQSQDTTSYLLLFAKLTDGRYARSPVYAGGMKYGTKESLRSELEGWVEGLRSEGIPPARELEIKVFPRLLAASPGDAATEAPPIADFLSYADSPRLDPSTTGQSAQTLDGLDCRVPFPKENCEGAHPHKVSSAFPLDYLPCSNCKSKEPCSRCRSYESRLARAISSFIERHPVAPDVKAYLSLYSMGGAIEKRKPADTAFWYRKKKFVIQIEAWWNYPKGREHECRRDEKWQRPYIEWVRSFRESLRAEGLIEGAFINFIDRDISLREYYGGNFKRLRKLKKKWDSKSFFQFEMSIPPG